MNSTLLVVVLVLTNVYLVAGSPDCIIVKEENDTRLNCMNGRKLYGFLTYKPAATWFFSKKSIAIEKLGVGEYYRRNGVATLLLNYFIENIAKAGNFQQITLLVLGGKGNVGAVKLYEKAGFIWVDDNAMILNLLQ